MYAYLASKLSFQHLERKRMFWLSMDESFKIIFEVISRSSNNQIMITWLSWNAGYWKRTNYTFQGHLTVKSWFPIVHSHYDKKMSQGHFVRFICRDWLVIGQLSYTSVSMTIAPVFSLHHTYNGSWDSVPSNDAWMLTMCYESSKILKCGPFSLFPFT